ncbi:MAG: patatin-like phospholipase family protein [Desulfosarcina sp.]|nr:patatin-like phospholipase family protein [Desulfobacterales bacterium]
MQKPHPQNNFQGGRNCLICLLVAFWTLCLPGCPPKRTPLPAALMAEAAIPGMPGVRSPACPTTPVFRRDLVTSFQQEMGCRSTDSRAEPPGIHILALSGGGSNGAFGAGLLCGWSETGTRPDFKIVTGISTGALIAPFAFLGRGYDSTLRYLYTSLETSDLVGIWPRMIMNGTVDSLADSYKVANLIARYYDKELIQNIARSHRQGRRLYIGTASLDANQLVVWNMGAIALHDTPEAVERFQQILVASVSIPILFPPEYFDVEAEGQPYDELHVDGGVVRQVFVFDSIINLQDIARQAGQFTDRPAQLFIIQNLPTAPVYNPVKPLVTDIAQKAIMDLFSNQGVGDLYRIYAHTERHDMDFNLISIPPEFKPRRKELIDHQDMTRLFEIGLQMGRSDVPWQKKPPDHPNDPEPHP